MLPITRNISIPLEEIEFSAIRSPGPGGQNVNKVATAIHLRFDIRASSLPDQFKDRLLVLSDHRITKEGVVVIKAGRFRSQEKNREDALYRLQEILKSVSNIRKKRKPTRPSRGSQLSRMDSKTKRGRVKSLRGKVRNHD